MGSKMGKSRKTRNRMAINAVLTVFLIFAQTHLSGARPRTCVYVELDSETHVNPSRLKLTYHVPPTHQDRPTSVSIAAGPVQAGAGLVFERIAADGTKTAQTLPPEPWWFSRAETLRITSSTLETHFDVWVLAETFLKRAEPGIYHISYVHPWAGPPEDPNSLIFRSNTLTVALVAQQRYDQLHLILLENPELALASYRFKNPPAASEIPRYRRSIPRIIDKAVEEGAGQDEVLLLLGSPDIVARATIGELKAFGWWDESWDYETSPVGGYKVMFKNGRVVKKMFYADSSDP